MFQMYYHNVLENDRRELRFTITLFTFF